MDTVVSPTLHDDNHLHEVFTPASPSADSLQAAVLPTVDSDNSTRDVSQLNSTTSLVSPTSSSIAPTIPAAESSHVLMSQVQSRDSPRIFLDICCGSHRPLSQALSRLGADVVSIDKLFNLQHDLLDCEFMETLLRIAASGVVGYTAASPSCSE